MTDRTVTASTDVEALITLGADAYQDGVIYENAPRKPNLIDSLTPEEFANWDGRDELALVGPSRAVARG